MPDTGKELEVKKHIKTSGSKNVSLYVNPFSEEKEFYGRVSRNTVTLENLIADITDNQIGISADMIYHTTNLLMTEIIRKLRLGNAVELFGAGTLYIKVDGSVKGENPSTSDVQGFRVGFTPSKDVLDAVSQIKIDSVSVPDTGARINSIINVFDQNNDKTLFRGLGARIKGSKLKISGENCGIFFTPVVDEEPVTEEAQWTKVDERTVSTNMPSTLEFYVPKTLDTDKKYSIVLKTRFSSGRELKVPSIVYSSPVTIEDADGGGSSD